MAFAQVHDVNQIPEEWHQVAVKFRKINGIRDGDQTVRLW